MGIHTGAAELHENVYHGYLSLARVQRVMSVAHGGQILLSNASAELIRGELPEDVSLMDMKEHRLKGLLNPEHLWQLIAPETGAVAGFAGEDAGAIAPLREFSERLARGGRFRATILPTAEGLAVGVKVR